MSREWSEADHVLARRIVDAIKVGGGSLVGALSVVRHVGLPARRQDRDASLWRVYRVVPLAVELSVEMYPGHVLQVHSDHTYRLVSEIGPDAITVIRGRMRKATSANRRSALELSVAKTPAEKMLKTVAESRCSNDEMFNQIMDLVEEQFEDKSAEVSAE